MENGMWNNNELHAFDIAKDYELEKKVRQASKNRELLCMDKNCSNRILKFCNGEIRGAYFAHRENSDCSYDRYERSHGKKYEYVRHSLYNELKRKGYNVSMEQPIGKRHYAQIVIINEDGSKEGIEFASVRISISDIERIEDIYKENATGLIWVLVDKPYMSIDGINSYFIKKYCLNDTPDKTLTIIDKSGECVTQFRKGPTSIYRENRLVAELVMENQRLVIRNFNERFASNADNERYLLRHEKEIACERINNILKNGIVVSNVKTKTKEDVMTELTPEDKIILENEIEGTIDDQLEKTIDSKGRRWLRCFECGEISLEENFVSSGGKGEFGIGICRKCSRK